MPQRNLLAIVMVGVVSLLCWQTGHAARPKDELMQLHGLFADAMESVEANYVRKVPRKELLESALRGMLQNLDPHSAYFSETDFKQFKKQIDGNYTGIGVTIDADTDSGRIKVVAPMVNSPAYKAGIQAGDVVLEVDGQSTEGLSYDKAVEMIQGRPGTTVKLTILHPATEKTETVSIRRALIDLPSVLADRRTPDDKFDFMYDKDKKVGYIRISSFIQGTTDDLKKALSELKEQGMKALVLDLRDDPGGLLSAAVEVADLFIEDGLIVSTRGRNYGKERTYEAEKEGTYSDFPMAVLVNQHSASASEIVAACLQDHHRAVVVGQRSYGKGSVQNLIPLDRGESVLKLTVATYWRPSGKNIHRFPKAKEADDWGVRPDSGMEVKVEGDDYATWFASRHQRDLLSSHNQPKANDGTQAKFVDRQLDKALDVVRKKLAEK
jgi:carboxyl-terminal processing protease